MDLPDLTGCKMTQVFLYTMTAANDSSKMAFSSHLVNDVIADLRSSTLLFGFCDFTGLSLTELF